MNPSQTTALVLKSDVGHEIYARIGAGLKIEQSHVVDLPVDDANNIARLLVTSGRSLPKELAKKVDKKLLRAVRKEHRVFLQENTAAIAAQPVNDGFLVDAVAADRELKNGDVVRTIRFRKPAVKTVRITSIEELAAAVKGAKIAHFSEEDRVLLSNLLNKKLPKGGAQEPDEKSIDVVTESPAAPATDESAPENQQAPTEAQGSPELADVRQM